MQNVFSQKSIVCIVFIVLAHHHVNRSFCYHSITVMNKRPEDSIRVIAYYYGSAAPLDNYDVTRVTNLIFCFGQLNGNRFQVTGTDSMTIRKMVSLKKKNPGLKVIVSLFTGCGLSSKDRGYSLLTVIKSLIYFFIKPVFNVFFEF